MSLAEVADQIEAWNEVHGDSTSLTDQEAESLAAELDRMEAAGSA